MKSDNIIQKKSYDFAVKIVLLCKEIINTNKEFILTKQLIRSGTSVGANIEEAIGGQSKKDFFAKLTIAYKEARESHYWIRLLYDTGYINLEQKNELLVDCDELLVDCDELLKIIGAIQKTMRKNSESIRN